MGAWNFFNAYTTARFLEIFVSILFVINISKFIFMFNDQFLFLHLYGNPTIMSLSHAILFKLVFLAKYRFWFWYNRNYCWDQRVIELLSSLSVRRLSSVVRPSVRPLTFHILINSSEATGPIWTKLWWNGPFQNCVRGSRLLTKMAVKLKIEKRGDEILIVHCCFSISQNELKF